MGQSIMQRLAVIKGPQLLSYDFPRSHPLKSDRVEIFWRMLEESEGELGGSIIFVDPVVATDQQLLLFHERDYLRFVQLMSNRGGGLLDYGDTPAFKGCYEAAAYCVGSTLKTIEMVLNREADHGFNPVGGFHHARRSAAAGFCIFNDAGVAIEYLLRVKGISPVAYVDMDAHHGDGVCYEFYSNKKLIFVDIHQDGRSLYPGSGFAYETGEGEAVGTKLNTPLPAGSGDSEFKEAFEKGLRFLNQFSPRFILFQCGADGLEGDPLTGLRYSEEAHAFAAARLNEIAHRLCEGRLVALGGGGYSPDGTAKAWMQVAKALIQPP
ncbi:MAG: acetoin utilization protein AcuC [Nitrososphaeria archaeon]